MIMVFSLMQQQNPLEAQEYWLQCLIIMHWGNYPRHNRTIWEHLNVTLYLYVNPFIGFHICIFITFCTLCDVNKDIKLFSAIDGQRHLGDILGCKIQFAAHDIQRVFVFTESYFVYWRDPSICIIHHTAMVFLTQGPSINHEIYGFYQQIPDHQKLYFYMRWRRRHGHLCHLHIIFNFLIALYLCNELDETETFLDIIANCMAIPHSFSHIFHVVVGSQPCSEQYADVALLY